ncbi:MAG: heme exporter protein CcmB [Alphaproteobacteria bacterium]|nr:heme exporter protein CcmB [Alphaproteobacteria bacterium]
MTVFWSLVRRDLVLTLRQGGGAGMALGFFLTVLVLLPLGIGPDLNFLQRLAPGALWITLLLSVLLSTDRIFAPDYEDGSLELMTMGPMPLELVALAKSVAHWLGTGLPLAILAPGLGVLLNLDTLLFGPIMLAMVLGSLALSLLACLGAAVTVGLRRGGMIISLLILPLYVPVLIFGVAATNSVTGVPELFGPSMLILTAISLASLVLAPIAAAAAVRAHMT